MANRRRHADFADRPALLQSAATGRPRRAPASTRRRSPTASSKVSVNIVAGSRRSTTATRSPASAQAMPSSSLYLAVDRSRHRRSSPKQGGGEGAVHLGASAGAGAIKPAYGQFCIAHGAGSTPARRHPDARDEVSAHPWRHGQRQYLAVSGAVQVPGATPERVVRHVAGAHQRIFDAAAELYSSAPTASPRPAGFCRSTSAARAFAGGLQPDADPAGRTHLAVRQAGRC